MWQFSSCLSSPGIFLYLVEMPVVHPYLPRKAHWTWLTLCNSNSDCILTCDVLFALQQSYSSFKWQCEYITLTEQTLTWGRVSHHPSNYNTNYSRFNSNGHFSEFEIIMLLSFRRERIHVLHEHAPTSRMEAQQSSLVKLLLPLKPHDLDRSLVRWHLSSCHSPYVVTTLTLKSV